MYRGESGCPTHATNYAVIADGHIPSRARLSIPPQLTLRAINNQTAPNFMGRSHAGFTRGSEILETHGIPLVKNEGLENLEFSKWHGKV